MEKKELRRQMRELKKTYSLEQKIQKSLSVWKIVEQDEHFKAARIVLIYWSMEDEVFTPDFVGRWAKEKTILLPCVKGDQLELRYFEGKEKLCPGEGYAIPEPVGKLFTDLNKIDLILVPGVAFDQQGNRLGRGKGFYDKILKLTNAYKIGVCFDFQYLDNIPTEAHDIRMDQVICSCREG
ncbi:MAG: 5-formyltetrahydrofolate cyclo-ligase [Odoribacter sp.]